MIHGKRLSAYYEFEVSDGWRHIPSARMCVKVDSVDAS
jgi:hypothetical protein